MLKLRKAMSGEEENKALLNQKSENYASLYTEYEERLATECSNGTIELDDCSAKLANYDPEGEAYANFFSATEEDEPAKES